MNVQIDDFVGNSLTATGDLVGLGGNATARKSIRMMRRLRFCSYTHGAIAAVRWAEVVDGRSKGQG